MIQNLIVTRTVTRTQYNGTSFTAYEIEATTITGDKWTVERRYSEFFDMDTQLRKIIDKLPRLPPKNFIGNMDEDFVQRRMEAIQIYLSFLTKLGFVCDLEVFRDFLEIPQVEGESGGNSKSLKVPFDIAEADICGTLLKEEHGLFKGWDARFCFIKGSLLYYMKSQGDSEASGILDLRSSEAWPAWHKRKCSFCLKCPSALTRTKRFFRREYYFQAESKSQMEEWVRVIKAASKAHQQNHTSAGYPSQLNDFSDEKAAGGGPLIVLLGPHTALSDHLVTQLEPLVEAGKARVRVAAHLPPKDGLPQGFHCVSVNYTSPSSLRSALNGASTVLLNQLPPTASGVGVRSGVSSAANRIGAAERFTQMALAACKHEGVKHVVKVSVCGAALDSELESLRSIAKCDQMVRTSGLSYTLLRPSAFYQSILALHARSICESSCVYLANGSVQKASFICAEDAANVAAICVLDPNAHRSREYELCGPETLSMVDICERLSECLERRIATVDLQGSDGLKDHLEACSVPPAIANTILEQDAWLQSERLCGPSSHAQKLLGNDLKPMSQFLSDHSFVFKPFDQLQLQQSEAEAVEEQMIGVSSSGETSPRELESGGTRAAKRMNERASVRHSRCLSSLMAEIGSIDEFEAEIQRAFLAPGQQQRTGGKDRSLPPLICVTLFPNSDDQTIRVSLETSELNPAPEQPISTGVATVSAVETLSETSLTPQNSAPGAEYSSDGEGSESEGEGDDGDGDGTSGHYVNPVYWKKLKAMNIPLPTPAFASFQPLPSPSSRPTPSPTPSVDSECGSEPTASSSPLLRSSSRAEAKSLFNKMKTRSQSMFLPQAAVKAAEAEFEAEESADANILPSLTNSILLFEFSPELIEALSLFDRSSPKSKSPTQNSACQSEPEVIAPRSRIHVLREILDSEYRYVRYLNQMYTHFFLPLRYPLDHPVPDFFESLSPSAFGGDSALSPTNSAASRNTRARSIMTFFTGSQDSESGEFSPSGRSRLSLFMSGSGGGGGGGTVSVSMPGVGTSSSEKRPPPEILPQVWVQKIFPLGFERIVSVNKSLLEAIQGRVLGVAELDMSLSSEGVDVTDVPISDIFLDHAPQLKLYLSYTSSYTSCVSALQEARDKFPMFDEFLEWARSRPDIRGQNLESLLIMPVQRIARYKLLLQELGKNTPPGHEDYSGLPQAIEKVSENVKFVDVQKGEASAHFRVLQLQSELKIKDLVQPHRKLIREGRVGYITSGGSESELSLYLFNDLVLYAKSRYLQTFVRSIDLASCSAQKEATDSRSFRLGTGKKTVKFVCMAPVEAESWVSDFQTAIFALLQK